MLLMVVPGCIALIFGVGFLCTPQLVKHHPPTKSWIETDTFFLQHRISVSLVLVAMGLFCLSSAYYVWLRLRGF